MDSSQQLCASARLLLVCCVWLTLSACCASLLCPQLPVGYAANVSTASSLVTADYRTRSFIVYLPPSYPASSSQPGESEVAFPLVLLLHPGLSSAALAQRTYGLNAQAALHSFVAVYPQGLGAEGVNSSWNAGGGCCGTIAATGVDDVSFLLQLLGALSGLLCLDPKAVFSTGISDGAILTQRLGCDAAFSPALSAIAPVEGTLPPHPFECNSTTPLSVLEVHGTNDTNIPFAGGLGCGASGTAFTSVPTTLSSWTAQQRCALSYSLSAPSVSDLDATIYSYGPCAGPVLQAGDGSNVSSLSNVSVQLVLIAGGGHTWSGAGPQANGPNCSAAVGDWPASAEIWRFFDAHRQVVAKATAASSSSGSSSGSSSISSISASTMTATSSPSSSSSSSSSSSVQRLAASAAPQHRHDLRVALTLSLAAIAAVW
jgi:polyhydroxybutyrate depolymerase